MAKKRVPKKERPVFDSLRKPTAPSTKTIGDRRPEDRIHPSQRKSKHKKKEIGPNLNDDV